MKNKFLWEHLRAPEIRKLAEDDAIVLLPVGAIEQHGPHLPVNTDLISATWVSQLTAEKLSQQGIHAVIAPAFAIANSMHHMHFSGSLSIEPRTFIQVIGEQVDAIVAQGFRKIALVNGHGGNTAPINVALIEINRRLGFPVFNLSCIADVDESQFLTDQKSMHHSGEVETSIVLAYDETLVDPSYLELNGPVEGCIEYEDGPAVSTFHHMESHTPNGIMGAAYAATKEKGNALVQAYSDRLCRILADDRLWKLPV